MFASPTDKGSNTHDSANPLRGFRADRGTAGADFEAAPAAHAAPPIPRNQGKSPGNLQLASIRAAP